MIEQPTRKEYYEKVMRVQIDQQITKAQAYEIIESWHIETFGARRYVNFDSFRANNYRAIYRENTLRKEQRTVIDQIYDLLERFRCRDITSVEFVEELSKFVKL